LQLEVWELNHSELKATHNFGNDKVVRPNTRTIQAAVRDNGFRYTFPKHSLTILSLQLK
jgi:alpha-L-arabinofuranosidase